MADADVDGAHIRTNRLALSFHSFFRRVARRLRIYRLCDDNVRSLGVFLKVIRQLFGHDLVNYGTDFGVSELAFRLSLEFTFGELYGDNGVDSLATSTARLSALSRTISTPLTAARMKWRSSAL